MAEGADLTSPQTKRDHLKVEEAVVAAALADEVALAAIEVAVVDSAEEVDSATEADSEEEAAAVVSVVVVVALEVVEASTAMLLIKIKETSLLSRARRLLSEKVDCPDG